MDKIQELAKQIIEALKPLAQKIGQGAEAVYRMAVKDAFITGVESWILVAVSLLILITPVFIWKLTKKAEDDAKWMPRIMGGITCLLVGGAVLAANFGTALHYTFNPEYMALQDLLKTLKH